MSGIVLRGLRPDAKKRCGKNLDGVSIPKSKKERADVAISERLSLQSGISSSNRVPDNREKRRREFDHGDCSVVKPILIGNH